VDTNAHKFFVPANSWHYRLYKWYLGHGGATVSDRCSYLRIVLIKEPVHMFNNWRSLSLGKKFAGIIFAAAALWFLGNIAYYIYKHYIVAIEVMTTVALIYLALAARVIYIRRSDEGLDFRERMKVAVKLKAGIESDSSKLSLVDRFGERFVFPVFDFFFDTFEIILEIIKDKKQGSILCPLLEFEEQQS